MTVLDTLIEIINIPSVTKNEDALCTWLIDRFSDSYDVRRIGDSAIIGSPGDKPFIALYGHIDTVPVQGDPTARIDGERLVGLGSSDMKSGDAIMIELLDTNAAAEGPFDLVCVFYDKEEGPTDENGLEAVLDGLPWLLDAEISIVMEPTDLNLEFGCNGVMNADVVFQGASGHAARPWLGVNAITRGGAWLAEMDAREPEPVDIGGLIYREVFTITQAHGGIANNIIPPTFTINVNYRFPPIYSPEEAEHRLRSVAAAADEIHIKDSAPAGLVHVDHPLVDRLDGLIGRERMAKQGWTDVARLTSRGAVAVNYGPGEASQAHQVGESMPVENLDIVLGVMREFLKG